MLDRMRFVQRVAIDHADPVACLRFSPDGRRLIASGQESIDVWEIADGRRETRLVTPARKEADLRGESDDKSLFVFRSLSVSPDGKWVATDSSGIGPIVWSIDKPHADGIKK